MNYMLTFAGEPDGRSHTKVTIREKTARIKPNHGYSKWNCFTRTFERFGLTTVTSSAVNPWIPILVLIAKLAAKVNL